MVIGLVEELLLYDFIDFIQISNAINEEVTLFDVLVFKQLPSFTNLMAIDKWIARLDSKSFRHFIIIGLYITQNLLVK